MSDIGTYGSSTGTGFYWIEEDPQFGPKAIALVAIDDRGEVTRTGVKGLHSEAATSMGEAVVEHLAAAIKEADANLERRRRKLADKPKADKPEPTDLATQRFHEDGD